MSEVKFYRVSEPYGFFSNFSPHPIYLDGYVWKTVEHYFQANKFESEALRKKIQSLDTPIQAANVGRNTNNKIRDDWDNIKESVMERALLYKFLQHPKLRKELILTEDAMIIEHTENDSYWGDGGNGSGKNKLGTLLMATRAKVKKFSKDPEVILPPWISFPDIDQYDLFWKMGLGEDYLTQWSKYYLETDKELYMKQFPEVSGWEGIYD